MNQRHSFAVVAGVVTIMASFPLTEIFRTFTWMIYAAFAVIVIVGVAMLVRTARGPVWTQVLAMMAGLLVFMTAVFPSGHEFLRLIPTGSTFRHFNDLLVLAGDQVRSEAVPVPDHSDGALLLLTTIGIGLVAIVIDLVAVGLRRPALAGLPMLAIYSVPVAVIPGNVNFLVFLVPAVGYLWLLITDSVDRVRRFGRRFTGEGRDVELWEPSPLSSAGRRLGVVGIVAAIVLPLALPNMSAGILQRFNGPGSGPGVGSGTGPVQAVVDLNAMLVANLHLDQVIDMVDFQTDDPDPGYLRFGVADQLKPDGFGNIAPTSGDPVSDGINAPDVPNVEGISGIKYTAKITPVGFNMQLAPVFQELTAVAGLDQSWSYDTGTAQLFTKSSTIQSKTYNIEYVHLTYTVAALRKAAPIRGDDSGLQLLSHPISEPKIQDIVRGLIAGKTTEYDKVRALYDYFSPGNGFQYSLDAPAGHSGNALVDFLNQKKGFCVQYATALAMLVRTAGFPARVAFGFTRGTRIKENGSFKLTNLNLHAWTEVFFPNIGWVPFDATPADSITGSNPTVWAPNLANPSSTDNNAPDPNAPKATGGPGDDQPAPQPTGSGAGGVKAAIADPWVVGGVLLLLALIVVFVAPAVQRRTLRRRRRTRTGPQPDSGVMVAVPDVDLPQGPGLVQDPAIVAAARADAHAAWEELLDTMVDFDVLVDPSETPRTTASRLSGLPAFGRDAQDATVVLARAEERARYARMPLRSDRLDAALLTVRGALIERATRRQRLLAVFMPRSVTNRWRSDWIALVNRGIRAAARVRDSVSVIDPRRILASRAR
jgi:transglutaminase-like putative cysteine protease